MIHSSTIVQWADLKTGTVETSEIKKLFQAYAERSVQPYNGSHILQIEFNPDDNIKIRDWTGWTNVLSIKRIGTSCEWIRVKSGDKEILVGKSALLPVYHEEDKIRGFHGEEKYAYEVTRADAISSGDMARLINHEPEFEQMSIVDYPNESQRYAMYGIETRSGFFNANGFHLLALGIKDGDTFEMHYGKKGYK